MLQRARSQAPTFPDTGPLSQQAVSLCLHLGSDLVQPFSKTPRAVPEPMQAAQWGWLGQELAFVGTSQTRTQVQRCEKLASQLCSGDWIPELETDGWL